MKHLITYKIFESKLSKILYHGSPYIFDSFKNVTTFFSDTEEFASDYSNTKSFDFGLDNESNIYKVSVNTELFDVNVVKDFKILEDKLPNMIEVFLTNFPIGSKISKKELLKRLKGYFINKPNSDILNAKIDDVIKLDSYNSRNKVYKVDGDFVYVYPLRYYEYAISDAFYDSYRPNKVSKKEHTELFKPVRKFLDNYIKTHSNKKHIFDDDREYYGGKFLRNDDVNYKDLKNFKRIYDKSVSVLKSTIIKDSGEKISKNEEVVKLDSTWRFFENDVVINIIKKHGYGGYVAKENGVNTYAIFNPVKDVKIISYQFPEGKEFRDMSEYKNYLEYINFIYKKTGDSPYRIEFYKFFKNGLSKEEAVIEAGKDKKIEKEYWSLLKKGVSKEEAIKKAKELVSESKMYDSLEGGLFYELFGSVVYIDNIDIFGEEYRITLLKSDGEERIYIGSKSDITEDFRYSNESFTIKRVNKKKKSDIIDDYRYNIVYYVGDKKVETVKMNLEKSLAYALKNKFMKDSKYKLGKLKVEKNV